jgi:hypothetical protein
MQHDEITELLWSLPLSERCALLTCSIVEGNPGAVRSIASVIAVAAEMARRLPVESRGVLAERMRDAADKIEHTHAARVEIK